MTTVAPSHLFNRAKLIEDVVERIDADVHNQLTDAKIDAYLAAVRPSYTPTPGTRKAIRGVFALRFQRKPLTLAAAVNILTED